MKTPPTIDTRFLLTNFLAEPSPTREKTRQKAAELRPGGALVPTMVLHELYMFEYETIGANAANGQGQFNNQVKLSDHRP